MRLTFYGASREVTGSNYVLESGGDPSKGIEASRLMIDCGLHQGSHYAERQNFDPFPYDPKKIDAIIVTHAHLDHVGLLAKLLESGFHGTIYSTPATKDCAELLLLDSEHILSKEAEREHKPPLYTVEDVNRLMSLWKKIDYHTPFTFKNFQIEFYDAGHILGSAIVVIDAPSDVIPNSPETSEESSDGLSGPSLRSGRRIRVVFSGDLGNYPPPIIKTTEKIDWADYCVLESTYGDRVHENVDKRKEQLEDLIEDTVKNKGTLVIPTFAMERTQELLYHMHQLFEDGRVPRVPVFIDSPLAIKLTAVYKKYENQFNPETAAIARTGDDILNFPGLRLTLTTEQSKEINDVPPPKIILAGSGMSQGGRILHHEVRYLPDPKSTIVFVGYQAANSLGRQILDGADRVRIFGEDVPIRCHVRNIPGYSAHADQPRLLEWVGNMRASLKKVFVTHGEEKSAEVLAQKIHEDFALIAVVPKAGDTVELD